jgi:hypothetical protein
MALDRGRLVLLKLPLGVHSPPHFDLLALRRLAVLDSAAAAEASVPTRECRPTDVSRTAAMVGVSRSCRIGYSATCD